MSFQYPSNMQLMSIQRLVLVVSGCDTTLLLYYLLILLKPRKEMVYRYKEIDFKLLYFQKAL